MKRTLNWSWIALLPLVAMALLQVLQSQPAMAVEPEFAASQNSDGKRVTVRKTYQLNGQTIAQASYTRDGEDARENGSEEGTTLHYIYSDHLGSANTLVDQDGTQINTRFLPFGEIRSGGNEIGSLTELGFTGHRENRGIGLTYMNARFYIPGIGRFASADTIVPDPLNPQSYNRFSYVTNNPLNLIDPTGHCGADVDGDGNQDQNALNACLELEGQLESAYDINIFYDGDENLLWALREMELLAEALGYISNFLGGPETTSRRFSGVTVVRQHEDPEGNGYAGEFLGADKMIWLYDIAFNFATDIDTDSAIPIYTIIHEFGHAFDHSLKYPSEFFQSHINNGDVGFLGPNGANNFVEEFANAFTLAVIDHAHNTVLRRRTTYSLAFSAVGITEDMDTYWAHVNYMYRYRPQSDPRYRSHRQVY
ncbi:MAG: RHS repeat-associated core domain-containing protein [Chloroflexota bacterium]